MSKVRVIPVVKYILVSAQVQFLKEGVGYLLVRQSVKIKISATPHCLQFGLSCSVIKYECANFVCPIRSLVVVFALRKLRLLDLQSSVTGLKLGEN